MISVIIITTISTSSHVICRPTSQK